MIQMAEQKKQKKKKKGRRSYLADFRKDAAGNYKYTGNVYAYDGTETERKKYVLTLGILVVMSVALAVTQELLPGTKMSNQFYVLIPWLLQFLSASAVCWAYVRLAYGGSRLREYVWEGSDRKIPRRVVFTLIFSLATALAEIIYISINGLGDRAVSTVLRPCLSLINGAVSLLLHLLVKGESRYRKI